MMDNSLQKAAEMALEALESVYGKGERCEAAIKALREALDLETAIERGTKAWADVPDATEWVDELRGNHKPPVKTYCGGKPNYCTPEEAFTLDRGCYERGCVAFDERDGDGVIMLGKRVHKSDKPIHEPVDWEAVAADQAMTIAMMKIENKREWVGLTTADKHEAFDETQEASGGFWEFADYLDAKLKEKNS